MYLYTAVLGSVSLLSSFFDPDGRKQHAIARLWAWLILKTLFCPLHIEGAERLRVTRPVIFALNHGSALDIPASYVAIPVPFRVLAKSELFRYPFLGWHLKRSGQISIDQGNARTTMRSLGRAADALRTGLSLLVYPEGGRCEDGHLQPFQPGAFYVALKARCDIVPVALIGTWDALRMNSFHVRPHPITIVVGEPISTAEYGRHDTEKLSARVREAIAAMYYERAGVIGPADVETRHDPSPSAPLGDEPENILKK